MIAMNDLVDIVIPAAAQAAAEALGLKVSRSVTTGVRVRRISRDEAEIAVECLRDWGFSARITEPSPTGEGPTSPELKRAA
jgi:N6-adenosine-specific RNA methylase IME4